MHTTGICRAGDVLAGQTRLEARFGEAFPGRASPDVVTNASRPTHGLRVLPRKLIQLVVAQERVSSHLPPERQ
jgi:hypothetical protein